MTHSTNSSEFDDLVTRANKMVEGIHKHSKDKSSKLPARLVAAEREHEVKTLQELRAAFIAAEKAVAKASDAYHAQFSQLTANLAQDDEAVRGHFGKTDERVTDFGTKVLVPAGGRPKKKSGSKSSKTGGPGDATST